MCVPLERNGCAAVDIGEVEQTEELVFGGGFVEGELGWAEDEPALFPGLQRFICLVSLICRSLRKLKWL